ncbi:MAG: glycosyltransferase family 4 protein [Lachnospiraceae bacterium]|nr:glycosyltransferase family 4 protein [Lachnospiraceae bacterium]
MRILILANSDVGLYKFRKELLDRLISDGHTVYASLPDGDMIPDTERLGCEVVKTEISRRGTNPIEDLKLLRNYKGIIKEKKPDIVFTYTIKPNVYGGAACASLKVPYVANVTGLGTAIENGGLMQKITLTLYRYGLRKSKTVFFQNATNKDFFEKEGLLKSKSRLIPGSGVNTEQHCYEPYPEVPKHGDKFLFVGRIMKDKGVGELFEAAKKIKKQYPDVTFDVVGGFDENYYDEIKTLEDDGIIKYWGQQSDVHQFYKNCSAVVLPSYHEGMANVLLEASSTGRPVLASNIPGCSETFDEGVTGFGFKEKSAEDLFESIKDFIELDYDKKVDMGKAAREKAKREFDRNIVVTAYIEELSEVLTSNMNHRR